MGFVKDLWTRPLRGNDGKIVYKDGKEQRVPNDRHGKGKRWLACWLDPDGQERTKAFATKTPADKFWRDREAERDRGEYVDPKAGIELVSALGRRWFASISVDPTTWERYERAWRLHVEPEFGRRRVRSMTRPSEVQAFLAQLGEHHGDSTVGIARHVLAATLELAVADGDLRKNPARNRIVSTGKKQVKKVVAWSDAMVDQLIDAHPPSLRALPFTMATTGLREGEAYALAVDEVDVERGLLHIRRQVKLIGNIWCYGLPKNDTERDVPLPESTAAELLAHMAAYPPVPVTMPWETINGPRQTYRLLFLHPDSGEHLRSRTYTRFWMPALEAAELIGAPSLNEDGTRSTKYVVDGRRDLGRHQLRHYYANLQLTGGTNVKELADYLGHADPAFTLRIYAHLLPDSHDRARQAVDARFFRPRPVRDGTGTERGRS